MKQFFGALFILAVIVFLYKAGVIMPDLASAFGTYRGSYDPYYTPADDFNVYSNAARYEAGLRGDPYYTNLYSRGGEPIICYGNSAPVIDGVNYNPPTLCKRYVEDTRFGVPQLPTYRSYGYYPAPQYVNPTYSYNPFPVNPNSQYTSYPTQNYAYPTQTYPTQTYPTQTYNYPTETYRPATTSNPNICR